MSQLIQAIYENGLLRPLAPLDLPENAVVEIDVRDQPEAAEQQDETTAQKAARVLREADLTRRLNFPTAKRLSDEERERVAKLFTAEKSLSDYIDEDREARG